MNDILIKVQKYLDNVSKGPTQVDKKLVEEFGEACKNALLKQFTEDRRSKFEVRMSNVGRPLCQLQMEAKGIKGEGQPYNVKMRNKFGWWFLGFYVSSMIDSYIDSELSTFPLRKT